MISVHLAPVSLRNDFLGTVSIFQDITHQVEVDRLKSEFVATVSHELRTPMTSIKGYVEILLMGAAGKLNEQQDRFLQVVKSNTERLTVLVNDLLDISQIESGKVTLSVQPSISKKSPTRLLRTCSAVFRAARNRSASKKRSNRTCRRSWAIRSASTASSTTCWIMPTSTTCRTVASWSGCSKVGDEVQVDIKDSGLGINPADKERVFERFFRGQSPLVMGVAGTGLGLSIVTIWSRCKMDGFG